MPISLQWILESPASFRRQGVCLLLLCLVIRAFRVRLCHYYPGFSTEKIAELLSIEYEFSFADAI